MKALVQIDIVDSTAITAGLGRATATALWSSHDNAARILLRKWGGYEIDKTDGFLLAFDSVVAAANFAVAYQQSLAASEFRITARAAMHAGEFSLMQNSAADIDQGAKKFDIDDWLAKAIVSRTLSLSSAGRTILTASAALILRQNGLGIRRHGHWRFQGIDDPLELFELETSGSDCSPPSDSAKAYRTVLCDGVWLPVRELRHSLPAERDAFVGRAASLLELEKLLRSEVRLVAILGLGGVGKTRLALHYAWKWIGDFPGGVWYCDLSAARTLEGLAFAVAQGLGLNLGASDPLQQIKMAIAGRDSCLIVIDNFEQVAELAEQTLGVWLQWSPAAHFVVTSRQVLGIAGERTLQLDPLPKEDAAALFMARAADAGGRARIAATDLKLIHSLVHVLDGIPLAIELMAARIRTMSPQAMLARVDDRFKLLTSRQGRVPRQSTLRATLDWSWELLSTEDKQALAKLSIFEGSFRSEDADALCGDEESTADSSDFLQSLVEKSLVRMLESGRFQLLSTVREYADEKLKSSDGPVAGLSMEGLQYRHLKYFSVFDEGEATADRCAAIDDLLVACQRAVATGDSEASVGALTACWYVLRLTGPFHFGLELAARVDVLPHLGPAERSEVQRILGSVQELLGEMDRAFDALNAALALSRRSGNVESQARALCSLGEHSYKRGQNARAREFLLEALTLADALSLPSLQCSVWNAIGTLETRTGDLAAARENYQIALTTARRIGDLRRQGGLLGNLAIVAHDAGEEDAALRQYEEALGLAAQVNDRRWEGNTHCNLGLLLQEQNKTQDARKHYVAALAIAKESGYAMLEATVSCNLGILATDVDDWRTALAHFERAVQVALGFRDRRAEGQFRGHLAECLVFLGDASVGMEQFVMGEQVLRQVEDVISLCILLAQRARAEHHLKQHGTAEATLAEICALVPPPWSGELERRVAVLKRVVYR